MSSPRLHERSDRSPYTERFGTPRQANVEEGTLGSVAQEGVIELMDGHDFESALSGLGGFEYVWLITHLHLNTGWKPLVRVDPRGLRERVGLFATRSPHRPNHIGLSAVRVLRVEETARRVHVRGLDLLDGTPVLDMKPYVPYCDAHPDAKQGWLGRYDGENLRGGDVCASGLPEWCQNGDAASG
eukprot:GDKI01014205.1.p1 GENE.GDKI01014205.1~~GDKI01014205.1.p1  ORF type:complete len:185 (-),score=47.90 GDKI01014205.1:236-790(-)